MVGMAMTRACRPLGVEVLKKHQVDFDVSGHIMFCSTSECPAGQRRFSSAGAEENTKRPIRGNRSAFVRATLGFAAMQFGASSVRVRLVDDSGGTVHQFERERSGKTHVLARQTEGRQAGVVLPSKEGKRGSDEQKAN